MNRAEAADGRVFIVDDQEANVRLLERILARNGLTDVAVFGDGGSVLDALAAEAPDLILLDLHMPGIDGFGVLAALAARRSSDDYLPVIVLTADADRRARSRALAAGAHDFLVKPFDVEEVILRVRNLLETRRLHRRLCDHNRDLAGEVTIRRHELAESQAQWAAVTAALTRLRPRDTAEATATAVCDEAAAVSGLELVSLLSFGPGSAVAPLARRSSRASRFPLRQPLPDDWSRRLRDLIGSGAWLGQASLLGDVPELAATLEPGLTAFALLPLQANAARLGILVAATSDMSGVSHLARWLPALEAFAAVGAALLAPSLTERQHDDELRAQIRRVIDATAFHPVFQPIVALDSGAVSGYEALARFDDGTRPDVRFAEAAAVGLGPELELACLRSALVAAAKLPDGVSLTLNVSPALLAPVEPLAELLSSASVPIVLEITEHVPIDDYPAVRAAIASLHPPVRFAVDDAGAGFASFRHIVDLEPDFVKLDIGLIRSIERDPARQAFVAGMVYFAARTNCELIAEGIETEGELSCLRALGVGLGQGYLLGRPAALGAPTTYFQHRVA